MTGFARTEGVHDGWNWAWEVRSVNGRGLDVKVRVPPGQDSLDHEARQGCRLRFSRGSIQIGLSLKRPERDRALGLKVNHDLVAMLIDEAQAYVADGRVAPPEWGSLLAVRGVIEVAEEDMPDAARAALADALGVGLETALDGLKADRDGEGVALLGLFNGLIEALAEGRSWAEAAAVGQVSALRDRVARRAAELVGDSGMDDQRLAQEVALLATKADVREELDRIDAHLADVRALLAEGGPVGRRLDFLAQELHREVNTLTAKSATLELTRIGLDMKAAVDQLKEQAANAQ